MPQDKAKKNQSIKTTGASVKEENVAIAALNSRTFSKTIVEDPIPEKWEDRAAKAWEYFIEEPIVSNAINAWIIFAVGDEIKITSEDEETENAAKKMMPRLKVDSFIRDMILQLLVKGECVGYFNRNVEGMDLEKLTCINPISVKYDLDNDGGVASVVQYPIVAGRLNTSMGLGIILSLEQFIRFKWNAPEFSERGNSMVLPAFASIELLRDYRKAERAIAKRWTTPLRFIQVGGAYGQHLIKPSTKMLRDIKETIDSMDIESGLVVPFYVKTETYGTEGKVLDVEKKQAEVKEDIIVALGLSRTLITGDGPNFATASVSMQKFIIMLKGIVRIAREILNWIFDEWQERTGNVGTIVYHFPELDFYTESDARKLLLELYDRGLISKKSLQAKFGLDPSNEEEAREGEDITMGDTWKIQDVVSLVTLGIITSGEARKHLGIAGDYAEAQAKEEKEKEAARYKDAPPSPLPTRPQD